MKIKFYTLFYIDLEENRQLQGTNHKGIDHLKIFLKVLCLYPHSHQDLLNNAEVSADKYLR